VRCTPFLLAFLAAFAACDRGGPGSAPGAASASAAPSASVAPSAASDPVPLDVTLPSSSSTTAAPDDPLVVVLSRTRLALGRDGAPLAVPDPATWSAGFDIRYKRSSRNDYFLVPLGDALASRRAGDAGLRPVVVAADASVPYRVLAEALHTLGQQDASRIALLVRAPAGARAIELARPRLAMHVLTGAQAAELVARAAGSSAAPRATASASAKAKGDTVALDLEVIVTPDGFVVSAAGRRMAPGCREPAAGPGPAVPVRDGTQDFALLTACASAIKASASRFMGEKTVTVSATAATDLQTVVSTVDALRGSTAALFPEVLLGVPN